MAFLLKGAMTLTRPFLANTVAAVFSFSYLGGIENVLAFFPPCVFAAYSRNACATFSEETLQVMPGSPR